MRRDDVASTSIRRHFGTKCPLGCRCEWLRFFLFAQKFFLQYLFSSLHHHIGGIDVLTKIIMESGSNFIFGDKMLVDGRYIEFRNWQTVGRTCSTKYNFLFLLVLCRVMQYKQKRNNEYTLYINSRTSMARTLISRLPRLLFTLS